MFDFVFSLIALFFGLIDFRQERQANTSETVIGLFIYNSFFCSCCWIRWQ